MSRPSARDKGSLFFGGRGRTGAWLRGIIPQGMGLHREIERILARPTDALLLREIIGFWAERKNAQVTAKAVASKLHRDGVHVESLLTRLAELGVLAVDHGRREAVYSYALVGAQAVAVERLAHSKSFHEQKLVRSTDKFRSMYHRKPFK